MFEGLVRQLLLGYLGRYIKDFQTEQLKITFWNEEVLFENVELILDAFDYLQLPVALKRGHIGRLSIRIPWKKLGWDPIIILLEDVLVCAGPRDDDEWSADAVGKRELAAKKAKLAAAELGKLSRRVCDNQTGQSFMSHVTGRILDSIQVSLRNVHLLYCDQALSVLFGLRFSSLTISKQNSVGSLNSKARGGHVSKVVEVHGLGIHCSTFQGSYDLYGVGIGESQEQNSALTDVGKYDYIVVPFDLSFMVVKSGRLEHDVPQYSVTAELTKLVMKINQAQLRHILEFSDYICTCQLREIYGRYRPWGCPLSKKLKGWQKTWWRYALESIISEVHKKLKRTSWRYLGQRLNHRRKYVNLYKVKLNSLRKEQPIDEDVVFELEQMEKDSDIDDILQFRSVAEKELEDSLNSTSSELVEYSSDSGDKLLNEEVTSGRARGWLNWLSRGVLGAGGSDDSSQFSGIVSDEVIKDICEATKFQPVSSVDVLAIGAMFMFAINLRISQISLLMESTSQMTMGKEIADFSCYNVDIECNIREESTAITVNLGSVKVVSLSNKMSILLVKKAGVGNVTENKPSSIHIDVSPKNQLTELMLRVVIQPIEICPEPEFLSHLMEFHNIINSHTSLQKRVLESLNGIGDFKSRLLAKTKYVLSSRQKMIWDVNIDAISFRLPLGKVDSEYNMVLQTRGLRLSSEIEVSSLTSLTDSQCEIMTECLSAEGVNDVQNSSKFSDIYDLFQLSLDDFQVNLVMPGLPQRLPIVEKFSADMILACCIIPDEMALRQIEVHLTLSTFHFHFSASIYSTFLSIVERFQLLSAKPQQSKLCGSVAPNAMPSYPTMPFCCHVVTIFKMFKVEINLEDDGNDSCILLLCLLDFNLRYAQSEVQDCWVSTGALNAVTYKQCDTADKKILCSSRMPSDSDFSHPQGLTNCNGSGEQDKSLDGCFLLHYSSHRSGNLSHHSCSMHFSDSELHCYPYIIRLVSGFCDKLVIVDKSDVGDNPISKVEFTTTEAPRFWFQRFGLSNYCENGSAEWANIPLDQFPFVTIHNCGNLHNLESAILLPEWKHLSRKDKESGTSNSNILNAPASEVLVAKNQHLWEKHKDSSYIEVQLNIANINLHFHDLSCTVASIALPVAKLSAICHSDSFDVLFSGKGLTLFSSHCTYNFQKFVWGPLLPNRSPILNVRARKSSLDLEISFGIQHVCCVLPPEFLAILIGYFALPDWDSNFSERFHGDKCEHFPENHVIYKFEILDSMIISPVEGNEKQLLKLDVPHLYGSFIDNDVLKKPLYHIFSEFSIEVDKVAEKGHSLNIFGRDLCLSLSLLKDYGSDTLMFNQEMEHDVFSLIQSINFDSWLRLPDESQSSQMCSSLVWILTKISSCELVATDSCYFVSGLQALINVIDQLSLVDEKSRCFDGDVAGFLKLESLKDHALGESTSSSVTTTELRCCVDSVSIRLISLKGEASSLDMIARVSSGFILSATFKDDLVLNLDVHFSSLLLSSLHDTVCLAKFLSEDSVSSVLEVHFSIIQRNEVELLIALPSLDVWLQFSEWFMVIDHVLSCAQKFIQAPGASDSNMAPINLLTQASLHSRSIITSSGMDTSSENAGSMSIKFKCIGLSCHIPLWVREEVNNNSQAIDSQTNLVRGTSSAMNGGRDSKFLTVTLHSRSTELYTQGPNLKIRACFDKVTGLVGICESGTVQSWPFFQLNQLGGELQYCEDGKAPTSVLMDISCDDLDVWLSDQAFYFWQGIDFGQTDTDSSELTFGTLDVNLQLKKVSLLLTDGRWSCSGPLMELLMRSLHVKLSLTGSYVDFSTEGDLCANYNNIHKVLWEPFIEPWNFQITMVRKCDKTSLDGGIMTDVQLKSTMQMNLNVTTSLFEVVLRAFEMIKEARGMVQINEVPKSQRVQSYHCVDKFCTRKYASYTIYNKTSLPFVFHVYVWSHSGETLASTYEDTVPPGSSVPVYIDKTIEEQVLHDRPASSSDTFHKKLSDQAGHYFMTIQFEGTSQRSEPISMDLVGLTYFEVNFSKDKKSVDLNSGFLVPVVFDVSVQRYSKLIQLYSTVVFKNSTSVPLELRFDIPFGMSPKIVDPIYPGEAFPLPLHLAETGHLRWRPLGNNYLWNEVHNLSKMLSSDSRIGFLRSLVCYPALPSSCIFRCCLSVQDVTLPLSGRLKRRLPDVDVSLRQSIGDSDHRKNLVKSKARFIHCVTLNTPLIVKNYLPQAVSVTVEDGISQTVLLTEVEASFYHVDTSHDLTITFVITGFRPSTIKFPRAEKFSETSKPSGSGLSVTETMTFGTELSYGPLHVNVEKVTDLSSGARELCISVPFLLYNCTGFVLTISRADHELKENCCSIPSCYDYTEQGLYADRKDGLCLISSEEGQYIKPLHVKNGSYFPKKHISVPEEIVTLPSGVVQTHSSVVHGSSINRNQLDKIESISPRSSLNTLSTRFDSLEKSYFEVTNKSSKECLQAEPYMYSPDPSAAASEIMVRVSRFHSEDTVENLPSSSWSNPFFLIAPSGSTTVLVPQPTTNSAAVISVTSHLLDGPLTARTRAITFQPRYVISNACSKDLCYKQKGTESTFHLGVGQHSHLHWKDRTRELLVSVRFDEPGWQWSGSFHPEHLGDTQVKMRNYVTGASNLIRVEVQNADVIRDEKIIGNSTSNSGTIFILLSDDDTGFVPYRIDNLSKETLRIYQQKCETLETIVHPYTSCSYSWDEPSYPHRLIVEVPGERIIGSYTLDDVKEYGPVHLSSSSSSLAKEQKHERTLLSSVHAEGAMKVLSIIDSSCHVLGDGKFSSSGAFGKKRETNEDVENILDYKERVSVRISFIGISLINSYPQELLYASFKGISIDFLQSMERQRFSFQISSLQIDNQLHGTPYPVILSFHEEHRSSLANNVKSKDGGIMSKFETSMPHPFRGSREPVLHLLASKWRNKEMMLVSFEHINLKIGDLLLQIDLELLLKLLDFTKANPFLNPDMEASASGMNCYTYKMSAANMPHSLSLQHSGCLKVNGERQFPMMGYSSPDVDTSTSPFPQITPIGAPWQKIFLLARRQNKIYVEAFLLSPVNVTLSFSSNPWMLKRGGLSSGESLIHRGIMAFADVEGAQICLKELNIVHHMASWESIQQIIYKHYTRQFLHEMYKVFGSAGVIGNPMGFARRVGLGFKDFLSVPARGVLQSPSGIISGMAQGTSSLLSNTLYAISDTATQFSKAAHKGILAFTFEDHDVTNMDKQRMVASSQTKGVINELLEGLTGVLQSPIKGAEKHGLPGVLSGLALGVTGLVAKPAASVLEVTGRTAQSIRSRSRLHRMGLHLRVRLPRHLSSELPLKPYSWEEAIGSSVLSEVDNGFRYKDDVLILCKPLKDAGKFVVLTQKLIIIVQCSSLANLGKPEFQGVVAEPEWIVEVEIALESVIHVDVDGGVVHIVGSCLETVAGQKQQKRSGTRMKSWNQSSTTLPIFQTNIELPSKEEADLFLRVLWSTIEKGKEQGWGNEYLLHQRNIKSQIGSPL